MTPATTMGEPQRLVSIADAAAVRDSWRRLPEFLQLPLTLLSGKPYTGQRVFRLSPTAHLVGAAGSIVGGLCASWIGWQLGRWWWLPLLLTGWAMVLHGMRNLRMMMYHQSAHRNMWVKRRADRILGRIIAGMLIVQDFDRYAKEHVVDHHAVHHMTVRDPTVQAFLIGLGMRADMTVGQMWRRLYGRIFSPWFHLRFFWGRIRSYTHPAPPRVLWITGASYAAVVAGAAVTGQLFFLAVAWFLPLTLFFQISNTLRLCVKHTFAPPGVLDRRNRAYHAALTNAIFIGEAAPPDGRGLRGAFAWWRWLLRMLFIHLPARYLVLTGDTVVHDYHHRFPMSRNWANYIFAREEDLRAGHPGWPEYRQAWSLRGGINAVFASLAQADINEYNVERIGELSDRELFTAFDD